MRIRPFLLSRPYTCAISRPAELSAAVAHLQPIGYHSTPKAKYYSKAAYDQPAAPYNTVIVMDNLRRLLEDEEDASSQSTLTDGSDDSEAEEFFPPDSPDNLTSESDDDDDGYDSVGNSSEPEEIVLDKRFPTPERPPPSSMPFVLINGDEQPNLNIMRVPRRQEDRYHPYSRKLSYGYEETGHPLRRGIRCTELVEGQGMFNGYKHNLVPRRINGCFKKRRQLFYFVEWEGRDGAFPLEASIVTLHSPLMVIRYHQDFTYNPSTFRHL